MVWNVLLCWSAFGVQDVRIQQDLKPPVEFYVAPNGKVGASGSADDPFANLEDAQRAIRRLNLAVTGGVCVNVRGGTYSVKSTFTLTAEDSGSPSAPIVYRAFGNEKPVLDGGFRVAAFRPDGQGRIAEDVRSAGFTHFEPIPDFGWHAKGSAPVTDLYADGRRLILARHPNDGWLAFDEANGTTGVVRADVATVKRFQTESDLRAMGYWRWLWADLSTGVKVTDASRGEFALSLNPKDFGKHFPFYFENAVAALDREGEWVLDRNAGILHAILPKGTKELVLTSFSKPFVSLEGVRYVAFKGICFRYGRGDCMRIRRSAHVAIVDCTVQAFGNGGIVAADSRFVSVKGSRLSDFGTTALDFAGGNRRTLDPSGYLFADNDISRTGHWRHTYAPGLHLSGCGARILHNAFHDMPSSAMRLDGNDFMVASNVVERCVMESDDQGAIDIFANPSFAGVDIVHNLWRDIGGNFSSYDGGRGFCGQAGVRFDDAVSNMRVYGNRFDNCAFGIFGGVEINGGRNNLVDNNLFTRCGLGVSIIRWGKGQQWWTNYVNLASIRKSIYQDVCITNAPYKTKYPGIERLPEMEYVNRVTRNIMVGGREIAPCDEVRKTVLEGNVTNYCGRVDDGPFAPGRGFDPLPAVSELGPRKGYWCE